MKNLVSPEDLINPATDLIKQNYQQDLRHIVSPEDLIKLTFDDQRALVQALHTTQHGLLSA